MIAGSSGGEESPRTKLLRRVLVIIVIVVAVTGFFAAAYTFHFFGLGTPHCCARPARVSASSTYLVVVMANAGVNVGLNGHKLHSGSWPMMNGAVGRAVTVHV